MIRHAALTAILALALPAAIGAAELTPRPTNVTLRAEQFLDRFAGERSGVAATKEATKEMASQRPARPTLRADATVQGNIVRIGDLIENAGASADVAIFRAPDIGQTGTVPVIRVIDAVLLHRIVDLDTRGLTEVVVTRASRMITAKDVEARIVRALTDQPGLADAKSLSVKFDNDIRALRIEAAATAELRIVRLGYEPRTGRFDMTFDLPGSAVVHRHPLRFTGSIIEMSEVVVPTREIARGEVLTAADLTLALRPKSEFASTVVLNADQAIGLSPKHALRPGLAIRQGDLAKPQLVARNETVTITYEVPGIVVSIRGQALEAGGQGDVINVLNVQSKKTIQATVIGSGRVSVVSMTPRLANAAPSSNNTR